MPIRFMKWTPVTRYAVAMFCVVGCGAPVTAPKEIKPADKPAAKSAAVEPGAASSSSSGEKSTDEPKESPTKPRSENDGPILAPPESN